MWSGIALAIPCKTAEAVLLQALQFWWIRPAFYPTKLIPAFLVDFCDNASLLFPISAYHYYPKEPIWTIKKHLNPVI
jgi:hypothetical protein